MLNVYRVSGTFVFKSQTGCPAVGWNNVHLVWRSMWTGPCCFCCIHPPSRRHEWPATCHQDTFPHLATSVPGDDDEPKRHNSHFKTFHVFDKVLVCYFSWLNDALSCLTLMSVPSLQCQTMPSTRPSGLSWNQDRSCWKSTGGRFLIRTLPCGTRKWTGCFLLPTPVRTKI